MTYGLVLGGGGAKGAYQVGVMKALQEYNIKISAISGSSIGAINGLFYLTCDIKTIEEEWLKASKDLFLQEDLDDSLSNGICNRDGLINLIDKYVQFDKLYTTSIPLFVTIANNGKVKYVVLNNKSKQQVIDYILASSAMPIIYGSININGINYIDGGVIDNVPATPLIENGYYDLITVPLSIDGKRVPNTIEIIPSIDLGGLFKGTLNFDKEDIELRIKLGYLDALECLYTRFNKEIDISYVRKEKALLKANFELLPTTKDINRNIENIKKWM